MIGSLYRGISGIRTHQFALDSTSNNIANVNTTGYRANSTEFKSLFSTNLNYINSNSPISNDYNYGSTIGANAINANDGTYVKADGEFNVAYSGKGWFVVGLNKGGEFDIKAPNYTGVQQNFFTRDGSFSLDGEGYLVNSSGYYMYGINLGKIAADGTLTGTNNLEADYAALGGSTLKPLQIPKNLHYQPTLTTEVNLAINLNRTQNPKGITALKDEKGNFSMDKFLAQDINSLMDASGKLIDAQNFKDIKFSIEKEGITRDYAFSYGVDFKSMGELMERIKETTGLTLGLKLDSLGNPTDCSLFLSNSGMQDIKLSVSGKLADKLGLKANKSPLESAFKGELKEYQDGETYKDKDYVKYEGIIFQKNGDGAAAANPLEDPNGWTLIDSSIVAEYSEKQAKDYEKDALVVVDGKIYQKQTGKGGITEVIDPVTGEATITPPAEDTANWKEVAEAAIGSIGEYKEGETYEQDSIVSHNGILYQKINGTGNTNPAEDSQGWKPLRVNGITSTQLQVPTYETNTEIFSDSGEKFILKSQYVLLEQSNPNANPATLEHWEVRTEIYDSTGKMLISDAPVMSEITFNADGSANATPFEVPFNNQSISVDLTKSEDGKTSSNFAYTDSTTKSVTQDGTQAGIVKNIIINNDGILLVNFTNGKMEPIGRFGIAAFVNDQGLSKIGGNLFEMNVRTINEETNVVSGPPILAWNEKGLAGLKFGQVMDHMLETSNVDTGTALTDLIIYQRGYQMSAKSITTADQLMQEAIQLKR
ncbi:flagellar hook-basal body complex protein [Helicobacter sp.]|uniref:flagellar hook-basal body complex protein n=1 Tax=Helicobacter sp. TaxID=218 RepID=UPI0025C5148D|nr:flagellar hook-basal body complex protein [Helicobacter sp.]MCI5968801.1 flagellar hook-basal body complex protein [Helicobacter sp.]MDY2584625.1 flagellar hook-basal body complex protein [Helicobacter sp.]